MRPYAQACAAAFVAVATLIAIANRLFEGDRVPTGPGDDTWLGVASYALLLAGAALAARRPARASALISFSGAVFVVGRWGHASLSLLVWTLAYAGLIHLIRQADQERAFRVRRAAIHDRIDEEIVDASFDSASRAPRTQPAAGSRPAR